MNYFKLYIFFKNLNRKLVLIKQKSFISNSDFIKINNLLFFIKLFKYISIFIYLIKNLKNINIAKKIFNNLYYIIKINILLKLIPSI